MRAQEMEPVVLLSESEAAPSLAQRLASRGHPPVWYRSIQDLLRGQPLSSVSALVVLSRPLPRGILLAALGRMTLEYPAMQKVAVMEMPPPLPMAEYLTACGVDLVWGTGEDTLKRLDAVMDSVHERAGWIAA